MHLAEHHCTPLNTVPVPGVYMGALARITRRLRFGTLCYLLPLYSPLRLCEEISMLDHLSRGRLEVGVGRGVSPFELNYHKVAHEDSRDIFIDALACVTKGLTSEMLTYEGKYYQKKLNVAHMIFPPWSYHMKTTPDGKVLAIDFIGNLKWLAANCAKAGLHRSEEHTSELQSH